MKLCVIGNSHAAMLAEAYREAAPEGLDLTFFASQGRGPEGVRLRGTELRAVRRDLRQSLARLGMPQAVNLAEFDGFVIVAMTTSVFALMSMVSSHAVFDWPSTQAMLDTETLDRPLVSQAAIDAALRAAISGNLAFVMVNKIRRVSAAPILIVPQPFPSEDVLKRKSKYLALRQIHWRKDGADVNAALDRAHEQVLGVLPSVQVLRQPAETVAHGFLTQLEFTRGAGRLNEGGRQPETDILHTNARYGALVLLQIGDVVAKF